MVNCNKPLTITPLSVAETYVIQLWPNTKYITPILIGQTVALSVGSTLSPFIIAPFLTSLKPYTGSDTLSTHPVPHTISHGLTEHSADDKLISQDEDAILVKLSDSVINYLEKRSMDKLVQYERRCLKKKRHSSSGKINLWPFTDPDWDQSSNTTSLPSVSKVRLAYVCTGSISVIEAIYFICLLPFETGWGTNYLQGEGNTSTGSMGRVATCVLVSLNAIYCFLFQVMEGTPDAYLAVYVTKGLDRGVHEAAQVVGAYWGAHGIGSIIGIPLAVVIEPVTMTMANLMICLCGAVLMIFSQSYEAIIWVSAALLGFGVATLYSASFGWCSKYITVTGLVGSVFVTAYSMSAVVIQPMVGSLFEAHTPDVMVYIIFFASVLSIVVYIAEIAFVYNWSKRSEHYGI